MHDALAPYADTGAVPSIAALAVVGDTVHVEVLGTKALGDGASLPRDAVFRIASLSKPVAAAAAMVLVDEGRIRLSDPVDDLLPELAGRRVLRSLGAALDDTVPARRAITVEDLLTLRMGFGSIMAPADTYPVQTAEAELELRTLGPPWPPTPHTPDEWMRRMGSLPLLAHPGESWLYNTSIQVLGVLLARAAAMPYDALLQDRIFGPLGMRDTGFWVTADRMSRFTTAYRPDPETGELSLNDAPETSFWRAPPAFPDASGWLVSTLDDYWSFVQMLNGGGVFRGRRLLSEWAVAAMTTDHLTPSQRAASIVFLGEDGGWGYGMRVPAADLGPEEAGSARAGRTARAAQSARTGVPGGYGWDGGSGTTWRTDPAAGVMGILLTQCEMTSPAPPAVFDDFWRALYGALG